MLPLRGVSAIDAAGKPFHDPDADRALFETLRESLSPAVRVVDVDAHINDPVFAETVSTEMLALLAEQPRPRCSVPLLKDVTGGGLMPFIGRAAALRRLRKRVAARQPIVGAGAGTGISAKFAERGGVDLVIIYNSGRFRMAGRGSLAGLLPYGDANAIVVDMAREVLPVVRDMPVLAGVCGTDPFRIMPVFLRELKAMGFDGVQNFPTVGLIDGVFRQNLEETGMSYDLEVEMIREARALGLLTCPYVFDADSARKMTRAGADVLVAHLGLTTKGIDRRKDSADAGRIGGARPGDARRSPCRAQGRPGALPRRSDRRARGRRVRAGAHDGCRRFLRRVEHRAVRDRGGHRRAGGAIPIDCAADEATVIQVEDVTICDRTRRGTRNV